MAGPRSAFTFTTRCSAQTVAAVPAMATAAMAMPRPPAAQASATGGMATSTAASPPNAVKPMIPKLNSPA